MPFDAVVVLGCRVGAGGVLIGAAERRVARAATAYHDGLAPIVLVSGGKRWDGLREADAFAAALVALGVPETAILRERRSHSTRQNARFSAGMARASGFGRLALVTCDWHLPRAAAAFRRSGFDVEPIPALAPESVRRARRLSERVQLVFDQVWMRVTGTGSGLLCLCGLMVAPACENKGHLPEPSATARAPIASSSALTLSPAPSALRAAEYARRPREVANEALASPDPELRAAAVRALARAADPRELERLLSVLGDDSPRVLEFAAFGLARSALNREPDVTRALAMRAASLLAREAPSAHQNSTLRAFALALGRLANDDAERTLRAWLSLPEVADAAALGLAQLASRRGRLDDATFVALLDAAAQKQAPLAAALYVFSRLAPPHGAIEERFLQVAKAALERAGFERAYAIRALGRAAAVDPLQSILTTPSFTAEERAEAARELSHLGDVGQKALAESLRAFVPEERPKRDALLESAELPALRSLLDALTDKGAASVALTRLTEIDVPKQPALARRAVLLRCGAARLLAGSAVAFPALATCDPDPNGRVGKLSRVFVLGRDKLVGIRAAKFLELTGDADPAVQEAALRLLSGHREFEASATVLGRALASKNPGPVAVAAEILAEHPERAGRAGTAHGSSAANDGSVDPALIDALSRAYRSRDAREAPGVIGPLIDAAGALGVLGLMKELEAACQSESGSLRERAERALRALGQPARRCPSAEGARHLPPELDHLVTKPFKVVFQTDLGNLEVTLDPGAAPVAVTRIHDLVLAGFYSGIEVHRVVPGFVVQFGDPGGDGYGGAARPALPSELGPTEFGVRALGFAESGSDTGSSQIFVTLGRFPHLDGGATYLGECGPGWEKLEIGDRILSAQLKSD